MSKVNQKLVNEFISLMQTPGVNAEKALDWMASHKPEAMEALAQIERAAESLRRIIQSRRPKKRGKARMLA